MAQKQQPILSPDLPWKVRLLLSIHSFAFKNSLNSNGTVNRTFLNLFDLKSSPSKNPINGVKSFDITVDPSRKLNLVPPLHTHHYHNHSNQPPHHFLLPWRWLYFNGSQLKTLWQVLPKTRSKNPLHYRLCLLQACTRA